MGADEHFALPLAVTIYSALVNLSPKSEAQVFVLDCGLSKESRHRLERLVHRSRTRAHIEWKEIDTKRLASEVAIDERFSPAVLSPLAIPEVLPERFERAIYLDSDVVVEADLTELWQTDFEGKALLAARERDVSHPRYGIKRWRELGLSPEAPYFNAGITVINLKRWREEELAEKVLNYLRRYKDELNHFSDQEGQNAILAGKWKMLDPRWNVWHKFYMPKECKELELGKEWGYTCEEVIEDPYIIHYTYDKPWLPKCSHPERDRFHHYLRESGWFTSKEYLQWRVRFMQGRTKVLWGVAKNITRPYRHAVRGWMHKSLEAVRG